ncbi:hypothetical protein M8C13_04595 [Crossiella sp. SN42]|uniref:hypothetical protein n=1 Tax=Crossiella sp. SN42 TaxID=2944808 RepID=UPI00207D3B7B|nr:hypothetical protein [Crossiella sp. SN42]MCO1575038.1 hypothetical protein [Crossiella sp. SN42]
MAPDPGTGEAGVVIPLSEVYREVREMHNETKEVRSELGALRTELRAELRPVNDHESRIRSLERKVWIASGLAAGAGAGLTKILSTVLGG